LKILKKGIPLILAAVFLLSCGEDNPVTGPVHLEEGDVGPMIAGYVYNLVTGYPINNVAVMVLDQLSGEWYGTGYSNPDGYYEVWPSGYPPYFNYSGTYCKVIWSNYYYYDLMHTWVLLPQWGYDVGLTPIAVIDP